MKSLKILVILIIAALAFSAQFEIVKDVYEDTGTITAQKYGYKDHNNEYVAILKVKTDIEGLAFRSMTLDKSEYMGSGIYHVYMQPGSRMLEFMKTGFISIKHQFPRRLESNKVYVIEVKGVGDKIEEITINIIGEPEDAVITFDGTEKGSIKKLKTSIGKHEMKVSSKGYRSWIKTIEVSTDNTMFNYELEKVKDVLVEIDSDPAGAVLYINGSLIGPTPVPSFLPPGEYDIKITKEGYEDKVEKIQVPSAGLSKKYKLNDIMASLTINTHEKATVFLNDKQITEFKNIKLIPQLVTVKVEMRNALPLEQKIILGKSENKIIDMYPQISTGTVQVAVNPLNAHIELWEEGGARYNSDRSIIFEEVPIGDYKLRVSKDGYQTQTIDVKVTDAAVEKRQINLKKEKMLSHKIHSIIIL